MTEPAFLEPTLLAGAATTIALLMLTLFAPPASNPGARARRWRVGVVFSLLLGIWLAAAVTWAKTGAHIPTETGGNPTLLVAIFAPVFVLSAVTIGWRDAAIWIQTIPTHWLIRLQAYRSLGFVFLILWAMGMVPGEWAWPAGLGDIAVGVTAIYAAHRVARGGVGGHRVGRAWNALGIADLVSAIITGTLTSPGPLHLLATDLPNTLGGTYPMALVPCFMVPLSFFLHVLTYRALRRDANQTRGTDPC